MARALPPIVQLVQQLAQIRLQQSRQSNTLIITFRFALKVFVLLTLTVFTSLIAYLK